MRRVVILGSTGSIGTQTIDVISRLNRVGYAFTVVGLAAGKNIERLSSQIEKLRPEVVCIATEAGKDELARRFPGLEILVGEEGLVELARLDAADLVVNALVGAIGLPPTLAALERGRTVALANKESLVIGGELVKAALTDYGGKIIPIDSEHSALLQALSAGKREEVRRLIITASGGPFLRTPLAELDRVQPEDALKHPNWTMGARITIDSATMVNKAFEVIEAHYLFGIPYARIEPIIHPPSLIHSLVEYRDGSMIAQLAPPDMRIPIQYALVYPDRPDTGLPHLDLVRVGPLTFEPLDHARYPAFDAVFSAAERGKTAPAVANAADEVLVKRFLDKEIPFTAIPRGITAALAEWRDDAPLTLEGIKAADAWAREFARNFSG